MDKGKKITVIVASAALLLLSGLFVYSQYSRVVNSKYLDESYYFEKMLVYMLFGIIGAAAVYFLSPQIEIKKKMLLACILIAIAAALSLLPSELPFFFSVSGIRYIEVFFIRFRTSTLSIIILLFAFVLMQGKLPANSRYTFPIMSGLSILFIMIIAVDGNAGNIFIATLLFSAMLPWRKGKHTLIYMGSLAIYGVVIVGYYFLKLEQDIQNISVWMDPYQYAQGKGYMKIQDFEIMKTALLIGRSSYANKFSGEILPTILILFGWSVFAVILGLLLLMIWNMFRLTSGIEGIFSKKLAFSITIYILIKVIFCFLVFFNLLPFFSSGYLPFVGYGAEIILDIILMGIYIHCCHDNINQ
ncbi:MAG TPA: FtsW/RodA/SpoVE family cell cycle protein [Clostridiales bacterium]|nr:FtsW/RodA/SpoVE family cell cycle protein [Clostridiales bacterium]